MQFSWEDLKNDPELLKNAVKKHGVRGLARKVGVTHPTVIKYLDKLDDRPVIENHGRKQKEYLAGTKEGKEERKPDKEDMGSYWIIRTGDRQFKIDKDTYSKIRKDYCGKHTLTINQITRKYGLPRWKFIALKTAFSMTHDDVPFTDEELKNNNLENLTEAQLQKRKDNYFKLLAEKEVDHTEKELQEYQRKDYFFKKADRVIADFWNDFDGEIPEAKVKKINTGFALEIMIPDLHLARLCWVAEVEENYDRRKAKKIFLETIEEILSRRSDLNFEKILFPIGNDLTNFDNIEGETTQGTIQDNDSRWQKMINTAEDLMVTAIERLRKVAPVDAFLVPGNHDWTTSYHIVRYLSGYYRREENVNIDHSPKARKYRKFGINLIGFTHGDKVGKRRIFGLMQPDVPELWGKSKYREWHLGHTHTREKKEENGVVARWIPSIAAKSSWEHNKGYTSLPGSRGYVWHKEKGLFDVIPIDRF